MLTVEDFSLDSHRRIFGRMVAMFEDKHPVDLVTLTAELSQFHELECCGGVAYLSSLIEIALPENFSAYIRNVRKAAQERRYNRLYERLADTSTREKRIEIVKLMQEMLLGDATSHNWQGLFHPYEEIVNVPPAIFAIDGFLPQEAITLIGGLAGHGKTLTMLSIVRALLEGSNLFHHFGVTRKSERVIYLIPEAGLGPFSSRLKTFRLEEHIREGRLFCPTLSAQGQLSLTDPRLLEAAKGADVFLDTAIRFMSGDENSAAEQKQFAETLFSLQRAGARTIVGAHHSPKSFGKDTFMTLENVLRGSGDIGAMLAACWGLRQIDAASNRIFVQNVKARDFSPCEPFIIQGRPSIDESGYFELLNPPGFAGRLTENNHQVGRPETAGKREKVLLAMHMKREGASYREIARACGVSKDTAKKWIAEEGDSVV
jgi:hypothetical protein